jgi:hypothetical protein
LNNYQVIALRYPAENGAAEQYVMSMYYQLRQVQLTGAERALAIL